MGLIVLSLVGLVVLVGTVLAVSTAARRGRLGAESSTLIQEAERWLRRQAPGRSR